MAVFRIRIFGTGEHAAEDAERYKRRLREGGLEAVERVEASRLFFLDGGLDRATAERIGRELLADPVTDRFLVGGEGDQEPVEARGVAIEIHPRPGVMDPVALSTLAELRHERYPVESVRTGLRLLVEGDVNPQRLLETVGRTLANDCIERVVLGSTGVTRAPTPPAADLELRSVALCDLDEGALQRLSRQGHLFLTLDEMRAIQMYFRAAGREPTDLELETLAQTWSEHCVHKTLKSAIVYRGAPMPVLAEDASSIVAAPADAPDVEVRYANLLKETIARATARLMTQQRGPECLSVFEDNAGVIAFDGEFGIAFKVETHNHPSAIEPYGGAATGIGGCIRDVIGCGLGARPIANTDVFCVAPPTWPDERLPRGVLHPRRVLQGVVDGVGDYGNRMGIPTVNGAVHFDPRYLGNPLVFCGCVGIIPRDRIRKAAQPGDRIVVIGGRTGRDGIHGATFSSAELTQTHADEFSHAVQIGNAIVEKRILDAVLRARDDARGCLYTAITDCGAGGLSSAVGEMGQEVGADVDLSEVPLKYAGLRYDEIWISEAQERMVLSVPPANLQRFMQVMAEEEVEATVIGEFGYPGPEGARLVVRHGAVRVGELEMHFLHEGVPRQTRAAQWHPTSASGGPAGRTERDSAMERIRRQLARPTVCSKEWVIRRYDHEVQGASVIKPLSGRGNGPNDAAVLRPRLDSPAGIAIGCGLAPQVSDVDPYWMAVAAIDEAVRNIVCVGGDPRRTAILDNFCWGRSDDPVQLGALVRAAQACHDAALVYGTPFISGKDSLNNEFSLAAEDVETVIEVLERMAASGDADAEHLRDILPTIAGKLRASGRLAIPGTLLISALARVDDVQRCIDAGLKASGNVLYIASGVRPATPAVHWLIADAIAAGEIRACHDCSDGGVGVALVEMAIGGGLGCEVEMPRDLDARSAPACSAYILEADSAAVERRFAAGAAAAVLRRIGQVRSDERVVVNGEAAHLSELNRVWRQQQ